MTRVADYAQLVDYSFDLRLVGGESYQVLVRDLSLFPPAGGEGALLTWNVRRVGDGSVEYEVKVNGVSIRTHTVTSGSWSAIQEAMPTDTILPLNNIVEFRVIDGTDTLSIGDVILWYRKEIAADTTRVADYAQLVDYSFDLRLVGGESYRVLVRDLSDSPAGGEGALLTWNVRRVGDGSVEYEVKVNGVSIRTHTVTSGSWSAIQEAMPTDTILPGSNTVEFRVIDGTDTLSIGDVILWYRKDLIFEFSGGGGI